MSPLGGKKSILNTCLISWWKMQIHITCRPGATQMFLIWANLICKLHVPYVYYLLYIWHNYAAIMLKNSFALDDKAVCVLPRRVHCRLFWIRLWSKCKCIAKCNSGMYACVIYTFYVAGSTVTGKLFLSETNWQLATATAEPVKTDKRDSLHME